MYRLSSIESAVTVSLVRRDHPFACARIPLTHWHWSLVKFAPAIMYSFIRHTQQIHDQLHVPLWRNTGGRARKASPPPLYLSATRISHHCDSCSVIAPCDAGIRYSSRFWLGCGLCSWGGTNSIRYRRPWCSAQVTLIEHQMMGATKWMQRRVPQSPRMQPCGFYFLKFVELKK